MTPEGLLKRATSLPDCRTLWTKLQLGSVRTRVRFGIYSRPAYAYGIYSAADQARRLGYPAISALELGVAGGRGLLAMESIAADIERELHIHVATFGFDNGSGMPTPQGPEDLPHVWQLGFFSMDEAALRSRLRRSQLYIGEVAQTTRDFVASHDFPPIGFISFDLDYYSSTMQAFQLFTGGPATRLPRTYCYFDDLMWPENACHNPWAGELRAIREFNDSHEQIKLAQLNMLRHMLPHQAPWQEQIYVLHDFNHPHYCTNITDKTAAATQKPL